jgi:hypothetical protein
MRTVGIVVVMVMVTLLVLVTIKRAKNAKKR